jgi:dienelactone hydrolase
VHIEDIEYQADGLPMVGHLAVDDSTSGPRPAVLVAHEGPGLDDHAKRRAETLAGMGYVAFALDYNGEGRPLKGQAMMDRLGGLMGDPDRIRGLGHAGLDILLAQAQTDHDKVAAIGFCFGGTMVLDLARDSADLKAVVGFHSGLATGRPAVPGAIVGSILACIGSEDPIVPLEQRIAFEQEMRAAGADWQLFVFGGAAHSFTNENAGAMKMPGIEYHAPTEARAWRAMLDLFEERFGPVTA